MFQNHSVYHLLQADFPKIHIQEKFIFMHSCPVKIQQKSPNFLIRNDILMHLRLIG